MIKEGETVSGSFPSEILTNACGLDVTLTFTGTVTRLTGPQNLELANIAVTLTAGSNRVRFQSAALERKEVQPDGTILISVAGRKTEFTGLQVRIDLENGDTIIIKEPKVTDLTSICKRLKKS
jgi:hypothetical protein